AAARQEQGELLIRLSLLLWDGYGQSSIALELLEELEHPVATSLRLHSAIDRANAGDPEPLRAFVAAVNARGDAAERTELGELLLWRGAPTEALTLLQGAGAGAARLRALALCLLGRFGEASALLGESDDASDLLWAVHLALDWADVKAQHDGATPE